MSTHYLSASNNALYVNDTFSYSNLSSPINVTLLEEGVGNNCMFHKVIVEDASLIDFYKQEFYALTSSVFALEGTPPSAPRVCISSSLYNPTYEPPDWTTEINKPFLNKKDQKYYVTVVSNYKTLSEIDLMKEQAIRDGVKRILQFNYKLDTDPIIDSLLSYYIFAEFENYYVPVEPTLRIKCLVSVHRKYIDAAPQKQINLSEGNLVFGYKLKEIQDKLLSIYALLNQYHNDMVFYNIKISNINLKNDADKLLTFNKNLLKFFNLNNISINNNLGFVEFSTDDCYKIKNVSYSNLVNCSYITKGLSELVSSAPYNNPTIINYVYKLDILSKIEYCTTPWYEFLNNFYYPKQNVPIFNNPINKFNNAINGIINSSISLDVIYDTPNANFIGPLPPEEEELRARNTLKSFFNGTQTQEQLTTENATAQELSAIMASYKQKIVQNVGLDLLFEVETRNEFLKDINIKNISDKLKTIKLCELSFEAIQCLNQLISITELDKTFLTFTYQEQKYDLIPFLEDSEKRVLFQQLLNNEKITRPILYGLITKFESDQDILNQIRFQTKQEMIETLINYMVQ